MSATQINMERETMFKWKKMALEQENQVDILKSFVKHHQECIESSREREHNLEAKNVELEAKLAEAERSRDFGVKFFKDKCDKLLMSGAREAEKKCIAEEKLEIAVEALELCKHLMSKEETDIAMENAIKALKKISEGV